MWSDSGCLLEAEPIGVKRRIKDASWDFVLNRWVCGDAISDDEERLERVPIRLPSGHVDKAVGITNLELEI